MRGRKPKHDNRIVRYVTNHGPTTQAVLAKALKIPAASIYMIVKRLVEQGRVRMDGKFVGPVDQNNKAPVAKPVVQEKENPAIELFMDEIEDIDAGIRSLQITRSYLVRRVQYLRANG
jgi:DNA-binding Lrp family transcriptional regulator